CFASLFFLRFAKKYSIAALKPTVRKITKNISPAPPPTMFTIGKNSPTTAIAKNNETIKTMNFDSVIAVRCPWWQKKAENTKRKPHPEAGRHEKLDAHGKE